MGTNRFVTDDRGFLRAFFGVLRFRLNVLIPVAALTVAMGLGAPPVQTATAAMWAPADVLADLPPHDATVGTLAGEAMALGGAASYSIPIALPPGRHGMQPALALNYSSRSGAGIAGLGWSLSGLSSLHRCARTPEQDGETRAVSGDGADRLCLDGQRLVVVDAVTLVPIAGQAGYGNNSAVYRTEIDSFVRVTQFGGALNSANSCFKVESKSGVVRYFGGTQSGATCSGDARVVPGGASAPLSWMLKQEVDPLGNTVNYTYAAADGTGAYGAGEVLLQSVNYTGFGADLGDRSVTLVYEVRPTIDQTSAYAGGGLTRQTRRLAGIGTFDGTNSVRSYVLAYTQSNYSGRSVLHSARECAYADGNPTAVCHDPTTFTYDDSSTSRWPHELKRLTIPGLTSAMAQLPQPDATHPTDAPSYGEYLDSLSPNAPLDENAARPSQVRELGDFDGDGTRELGIVHYDNGARHQYLASYTADRQLRGLIDADQALGVQGALNAGNELIDVNGDGRTDVVGRRQVGGQRKITVGIWAVNASGGWLPGNFTLYDLSVALPSPSLAVGCESASFADLNGDGRTDLLLVVPSSMVCGDAGNPFPPRELRVYLGQIGADPAVPTFAATPIVTRALANVPGFNGTVLQEGISLTDFDGDGLMDVFVSRAADTTEQNRTLKLLFSRNTGGAYTLGGAGQEIGSIAALANPPLQADEIHKQAYTTWADVNGDGLEDWISIAIQSGQGYWSVRLNKGGILGARMVTTSTRGLERCVNDPRLNTTNNNCSTRWQPVFTYHLRVQDVDSDGRADLLTPGGFAARVCVRRVRTNAEGDELSDYWCPENPQTGQLDPLPPGVIVSSQEKYYGMYAPGGNAADGSEAGKYGGDFDPSAYFMDALRFVQTSETTFAVEVTATGIVRGQSSFDMYGDGLVDQVAYLGNAYVPSTILPRIEAYALTGAGVGPDLLPDGTPVIDLETQRITYVSENVGVRRFSSPRPGGATESLPATSRPAATGDLPRLPELMTKATNGLGDIAIWTHVPLSVDLTVAGSPFYSIPAQRYTDARHYYFASSMPVVYSLLRSNGIGEGLVGARTQVFAYQEAMYNHQGRGFQGFRAITSVTATDSQAVDRELRTTTTYHQKFPLTGLVASVEVAPINQPATPISRQVNDWRCTLAGTARQVCPGDGTTPAVPQRDTVYFPYLDHQVATTYDLLQAEAGVSAPISEIETLNATASNATASGWDAWGTLVDQVVVGRDLGTGTYPDGKFIDEQRKTIHRDVSTNTTTWFLDRVSRETTTASITYNSAHQLPGLAAAPPRTVVTDFTWNNDRTPNRQVVQAGVSHEEATTVWCYRTVTADCPTVPSGTNYGLPSSTVVSAPDVSPSRRTSFTYSKNGIASADAGYFVLTATNALTHVTTTERRPRDGQVSRAIAPTNTSVTTGFDAFDRPIQVEARGSDNALIEPATQTALSRYDGTKCSTEVGVVGGSGETNAAYCTTTVKPGAPTTLTWHDRLGRQVKTAQRGFDGRFIVTKTEYDLMGTLAQRSMPRYAEASTDLWQTRSYDRQGRLTRQVDPATDLRPGNGNRLTKTSYSGQRTTTRVQDTTLSEVQPCAANTACFETKAYGTVLGTVLYSVDAGSTATKRWIDGQGAVVAILDNANALTRAEFDARGRRTTSFDPDQGKWIFVHNGLDELISQTDARGALTSITDRDALGRVREITRTPPTPVPAGMSSDVLVDQWVYDPVSPVNGPGQLDTVVRKRGTTLANAVQVWKEEYGYETTTHRLSTTKSTLEGEAGFWTSSVHYDANGHEDTRTYPSGLRVRTDYTTWGQVKKLSNDVTAATYWTATAADAWGAVTSETFGNGLTGSLTNAGSTGQAKKLEWKNGTTVIDQLDYTYDSLGNLKTQARSPAATAITETYAYDERQRLKSSSLSSGGSVAFDYTAAGNLRSKSDFSANTTNAYSYGGNGCGPHAASGVTLPGGGSVTYLCDANGNVIGGTALTAMFDAENRPRSITRSAVGSGGGGDTDKIFQNGFETTAPTGGPGDGVMTYAYDAKGSRYVETGAGTTRFGPNGYEKIGSTEHRHELGPVVVTRIGGTDAVRYVLRDRLGSTIAVSDAAASVSERRQFDAFGRARNADFSNRPAGQANLASTKHGFTGHTQSDEVWLVHMNGRVYDQNLGRFLSVDPIVHDAADSQSLNPYSYLNNNPLSSTDPSGYEDAKNECTGNTSSCVDPGEIKATKAATLTGSHIAGNHGGSSMSIIQVNPSPGGMASLAVAQAGFSSGYVIQASAVEKGAGSIAADQGKVGSQGPRSEDRPGKGEDASATMITGSSGSTVNSTADPASVPSTIKIEGQNFATKQDAAIAAGAAYGPDGVKNRQEVQLGLVEISKGNWGYLTPGWGPAGSRRVNAQALFDAYKANGFTHVAQMHGHWDDQENFSATDFPGAWQRAPIYLVNKKGEVRELTNEYLRSKALNLSRTSRSLDGLQAKYENSGLPGRKL